MNRTAKTLCSLMVGIFILVACNIPTGKPTGVPAIALSIVPHTTLLFRQTATATPVPPTVADFFARCPTAAEIARVNADLTLSFETDPTAGQLACRASDGSADLTPVMKHAYQSILVMRLLHFSQPLPWTDKQLYDWFVGSIHGIRFRQDFRYSHCCDPANVIDIQDGPNTLLAMTDLWIDPAYNAGLMDTTILLVHEARHNNGLPHTCPDGANDQTIAELGAWAVQMDLEEWLAQYGDPAFLTAPGSDPKYYREIALNDSVFIRRSSFCGEPTLTPGPGPTLAP
ncbi:MAG TPA: hypothetical protein VMC09_07240 [Anaerolineales bacterium]|nr:hypothetical protein [Anaerolineales bacterium]